MKTSELIDLAKAQTYSEDVKLTEAVEKLSGAGVEFSVLVPRTGKKNNRAQLFAKIVRPIGIKLHGKLDLLGRYFDLRRM